MLPSPDKDFGMAPLSFKSFIEESNDALAKLDGLGHVILANRHWHTLVGPVAPDTRLDTWPNVMDALARVGPDEQSFMTEVPNRQLPVAGSLVRLVASPDPAAALYLCRVQPVQTGLAATRDRFFTLIDRFPFGIGVHRDLRFLYVNQAALRTLGYQRPEELIGQPITSIIAKDDLPAVRQRVTHMMKTGLALPERETVLIRKDGSTLPADLAAFMIHDEDGLPSYVVVARDVTERRNLEERLRQSQRMEAVGRLAGGIAHDFNNVLAVVLSYAELIASQRSGLDVGQAADEIRKAAERAAALVKELLTFSRGRLAEVTSQDANLAIRGLHEFLQRSLGEMLRLELDLDPTLPLVRAGASHLEQVFVNLVLNARDAAPAGGKVLIRTRHVEFAIDEAGAPPELDPGRYAVLEVIDAGVGMPPEVARRAFEPFFSTKGVGLGTGLGLATVYGIARQAGGTAEIASIPGAGTTVRLFWPVDPSGPQVPPRTEQAVQPPAPRRRDKPLEGKRILLVEDDEAVRILVTRLLRHNGAEVLEVPGASQAQALQEQLDIRGDEPPALLLTDVVMPDKSGPELAREMRRHHPGLKVVFMSGYADKNLDLSEIQQLGASFIEKPFATQDLVELIAKAFEKT